GRVHFSSDADKVYYEGYLDNAEIPWDFSVKFFLDGKEYAAGDIAGKSGALTIRLSVKQNENCGGSFFHDYALQVTARLDTETCENIAADGATTAYVGKDKQLSYIVLPGNEKEFVVTSDVKNFAMGPISIDGIKMNLAVDFDNTKLLDKVRQIQDAAAKLDNGAGWISAGAATLKGGADAFTDGTRSLKGGASALDSGIADLKKGILDMQEGITTLNSRSAVLTGGSARIKSALGQINAALSSVSASAGDLTQLVSASSKIKTGINSLTDGLESLKSSVSYAQYQALLKQNGLDLSALAAQNTQAAAGIQAQTGALDALIGQAQTAGDTASAQALTKIKQQMTQVGQLLQGDSQALSGVDAFNKNYFSKVNGSIAQLYAGASALNDNYAAFHGTVSDFVDTLSGLAANVSGLASAIGTLSAEYDALDTGIAKYTGGVSAIADGYSAMVTGISSLAEGSRELVNGASAVHRASVDMTGGITRLLGGITQLQGGTSEFRGRTDGMDTEITSEIDAAVASMTGSGGKITSFASAQNENVTSVQFVIKTEVVEVPAKVKETAVQEEPPTLWQKFVRLFKR
ncbi:MAG: hypothetical protein LBL36_06365, partial [Clostridiales Family XIII bacterium]|nr:hypothetical protein [Clostridiales Family XIII bacterium]